MIMVGGCVKNERKASCRDNNERHDLRFEVQRQHASETAIQPESSRRALSSIKLGLYSIFVGDIQQQS